MVEGDRLVHLGGPLPARDKERERALSARLREELGMQRGRAKRANGAEAVAMADAVMSFGGSVDGDALDACFVGAPLELDLAITEDFAALTFVSEHDGESHHATVDAVLDAWRRHSPLVALDTGGWAPLPEGFVEQHGHLVADLLLASEGRAELPKSAGADVARLAELLGRTAPPDFTQLRELAEGFARLPRVPLPADFRGELRNYQRDGVDWLTFLSKAGLGALLADDMGLGKTVQAICALGSPALVACPASVLHAWEDELARFRPGLTVERYHLPGRSLESRADVTLTTHAILRRDIAELREREWDTVVLDESQQIKNPTSLVSQAAFQLNARFRIALTGTPIENRLDDLWSQMHFINPGLLGGLADFRERYAKPVTEGDAEAAERLRKRVRPFITRRLKVDVARELPPRTDVVLRCTLDETERAAYDAVRAATREEVVRELAAGRGVLDALEALLRLRQASCHVGLLPGRSAESSSKIRLLMETLEEVLAEGHRALIFSQWTSMLNLIEPHLRKASIGFVRLDGSTRDRGRVVETFQSEDGPPVMLISLKAGGTGLTLTRADHVFLVDPWWNPAVEDQAADRIHRIGQEHPVLVHRLVAEDTVEEQLLTLQERKRALSKTVLDSVEGTAGPGGLTREDLLSLLA
jgi:SNF2 family DNA or RNA helicase